jgi:hypothetical protein
MAAQDAKDPLVVLEAVGTYLMPLSKATAMITLLAFAERVEYDWSTKAYKPYRSGGGNDNQVTVKVISPSQLAQIRLSDEDGA